MPQFTGGDWELEQGGDTYYGWARIRSSERPDYYITEIGLYPTSETYHEDIANMRLMTQASAMYQYISEVRTLLSDAGLRERGAALLNAVDGVIPCGVGVPCYHDSESTCIVTWAHTMHRTECGCRTPVLTVEDTPLPLAETAAEIRWEEAQPQQPQPEVWGTAVSTATPWDVYFADGIRTDRIA